MGARSKLLACGLGVALGLGAAAIPAATVGASPTRWVHTASPTFRNQATQLNAVACTSPTNCIAVGSHAKAVRGKTLVESRHGTGWSVVSSPSPGSTASLTGVSCTGPNSCVAVGSYQPTASQPSQTLVESWNGRHWSVVASADPGLPDALSKVSCTGPNSCVAVGYDTVSPGISDTLVESWDGTTWTVVPSPNPTEAYTDAYLDAVSCSGPSSCLAVGAFVFSASPYETLVESWDGTSWSIIASPDPGYDNFLGAVACSGPTTCVAVGTYATGYSPPDETLVESWDGSTMSVVASPSPGTDGTLAGVSCTSPTDCVAAGYDYQATGAPSLVESWDGAAWSVTPSPQVADQDFLAGVSCADSDHCVAVGAIGSSHAPYRSLVLTGSTPGSTVGRSTR